MLETKYVGDMFEILVADLSVFVTTILYLLILASAKIHHKDSATNIFKLSPSSSHQHNVVNHINLADINEPWISVSFKTFQSEIHQVIITPGDVDFKQVMGSFLWGFKSSITKCVFLTPNKVAVKSTAKQNLTIVNNFHENVLFQLDLISQQELNQVRRIFDWSDVQIQVFRHSQTQ